MRRGALVLLIAALLAACRSSTDRSPALPAPAVDPRYFSDFVPDRPLEPIGPGIAARTVFTGADARQGFGVEVRDFLVAPDKTVTIPFSGGGLFEVREGSGSATAGGERLALKQGATFSVPEGTALVVTAGPDPLSVRAWIFSGR
jgi:hypothetical protein